VVSRRGHFITHLRSIRNWSCPGTKVLGSTCVTGSADLRWWDEPVPNRPSDCSQAQRSSFNVHHAGRSTFITQVVQRLSSMLLCWQPQFHVESDYGTLGTYRRPLNVPPRATDGGEGLRSRPLAEPGIAHTRFRSPSLPLSLPSRRSAQFRVTLYAVVSATPSRTSLTATNTEYDFSIFRRLQSGRADNRRTSDASNIAGGTRIFRPHEWLSD
jgi:hypothetical protein